MQAGATWIEATRQHGIGWETFWGRVRGRGVHPAALETDSMSILPKVVLTVVVLVATYFFLSLLPFSLIPLGVARWIAGPVSFLAALGTAWYVWKRTGVPVAGGLVANMAYGALVVGALGFLSGFVGPVIFSRESNMGPMLGIFVTGPLGFMSGGIWGLVHWLSQRPRDTTPGTFPVRHAVRIVAVGFALLILCLLGERLLETLPVRPVHGAKLFIPLWLTGAAINMWTGISKARYSVAEEALMFPVVFGIPAAVAIFVA
jgi:hypothetical protein